MTTYDRLLDEIVPRSTIDADLHADHEEVFRDIQEIKEIPESVYSRYPAV